MKKSFLAIAFAMVAMVGSAQVYVGGSLGLNVKSGENSSTTNFNIAPEVGYVLNESLAFGASFDYASASGKTETLLGSDVKSSTFSWDFKPYVRYTFYNAGVFSCFVDGVLNLSGVKDGDDTAVGFNVCPGVAVSVTDNISVVSRVVSLGWNNFDSKVFGFGASVASVGVYYTF